MHIREALEKVWDEWWWGCEEEAEAQERGPSWCAQEEELRPDPGCMRTQTTMKRKKVKVPNSRPSEERASHCRVHRPLRRKNQQRTWGPSVYSSSEKRIEFKKLIKENIRGWTLLTTTDLFRPSLATTSQLWSFWPFSRPSTLWATATSSYSSNKPFGVFRYSGA